ncbi:MFS transporter [Qipengyuania sp.]|uniref:MFS transporter n=1 Tax=Qipengyuania sp. TaxID=2004515 RepID=UPI003BA88741
MTESALPRWRRAAYGFGDFGFNLYWSTASMFLLYYYTDVLALPATTAGLIFLVAMVWDGISDPIMGYLAERTRTRWGSYRPYLLFGGPVLAVSLVLMFFRPTAEGTALVVYAAATHVLFRTVYTVMSIPYSSLSARITRSSAVRNELSAWRMISATTGGFLVAFSTLRLVQYFGQGDLATGFFWTAVCFAALSIPVFLILFATTREPTLAHKDTTAEPQANLKDALALLLGNRAFLLVFLATAFLFMGGVLSSKTLIYYYKYTLGNEAASGDALALMTGGAALLIPLWAWLATRIEKRSVWLSGLTISLLVNLAIYLNPLETVPVVTALFAVGAVGTAASYLSFWSMLPDTVEYGEYTSGRRVESLAFGLMSFVQKCSFGIAAALLGFMLDLIGYVPNVEQSPDTLSAIKAIMALMPVGFLGIAIGLLWFYPITRATHQWMVAEIAARKAVA